MLKQCPESEVHFRQKVVFPLAAVAEAIIERSLQCHTIDDDAEAPPRPAADPREATPTVDALKIHDFQDFYITKKRIRQVSVTGGCPGCGNPGAAEKHTRACKETFYNKLKESG